MTEPKADKSARVKAIQFQAQVIKVQTMTDGGIGITLDMSATAIETASKLMEVRARGGLLEIAALPIEPSILTKPDDETKKEPKGSGISVDRRRFAKRRDQREGG